MKAFSLLVVALGLSLTPSVTIAQDQPGDGNCYECVDTHQGYMNCVWPHYPGHVSCIPYATTCSVGAGCSSSFKTLKVSPDGSYSSPATKLVELVRSVEAIDRNCLGLITARNYSLSKALDVRSQTARISI